MDHKHSLADVTERSSSTELDHVSEMASLFGEWPMPDDEKMANLALFLRRQELSYILARYEIFKLIQNVKGSIFYFGVYHGAGMMTLANLSAALEPFNHTRQIVGFDTFTGYPDIGDGDRSGSEYHTLVRGGFDASGADTMLERRIGLYNANRPLGHIPKIDLVKGDVCETLPAYMAENRHAVVSCCYLTMNLYEPTKLAIEQVWPRMPIGAVLTVHSLNESFYPGATAAVFDTLGDVAMATFPFAPNLAYVVKR